VASGCHCNIYPGIIFDVNKTRVIKSAIENPSAIRVGPVPRERAIAIACQKDSVFSALSTFS
jgi:hypothetical protein